MTLHDCPTAGPLPDARKRAAECGSALVQPARPLDALLDRALDWIDAYLVEFDPVRQPDSFDVGRGQRLGELAILARTAARLGGCAEDPRVHRMVALLRSARSSAAYTDRLLRSPAEFMLFLESHATLHALGVPDQDMRALLEKAVRFGWLAQTERLPHREMDIRSCLDACGIPCAAPPLDELYRRSILATTPNPALLSEHDLYALTHVVMFVCDFGMRSPEALPAGHLEPLAALLGALVVVAARARHWDLLAEFLLCWSCLELAETELVEKGWEALSRAQLPNGAVPGPEATVEATAEDAPFEHLYHTTLVCALAASVRRGKRIERRRTPLALSSTAVELERAETDVGDLAAPARAWLQTFAESELRRSEVTALPLSQTLVGLAACASLDGCRAPDDLTERVLHRLADRGVTFDAVPPLLQCAVGAWAAELGVRVEALHGPAGFLRRASVYFHAFAEQATAAGVMPALAMHETWSALHRLDLAPNPPAISKRATAAYARGVALDADEDEIEELLLLVGASSADDASTRHVRLSAHLSEHCGLIPDLVAGLAITACRRYDLLRASSLLRLGWAIADSRGRAQRTLRQGLDFLALNQRADGAFGLFGPELAQRRTELGAAADDPRTLLPLSVDCLCTFAEAHRGWRLLDELAARADRVREALLA